MEAREAWWTRNAGALGVLALALVLSRPAFAYRTAADLPEFAGTSRVRWAPGTIQYNMASWLPPGLDRAAVEQAVAGGFAAWSAPECAALEFVSGGFVNAVAASGDSTVTLQFLGHSWRDRGFQASAAATTDIVYDVDARGRWRIADADVFLNAELFSWTTSGAGGDARDLAAVVTHELGHVVGLLHPCGDPGAPDCSPAFEGLAMYPEYRGAEQRSPQADDQAGICFLYPPLPCETSGCPDGATCTIDGCAPVCDEVTCLVGDRCGPRGCTEAPCAPGSCERGCEATCASSSGGAADLDPCASDLECQTGHCSPVEGYCTRTCDENLPCPEAQVCETSPTPECRATTGVFGAACASAPECASRLCLAVEGQASLCTRACGGEGVPACPSGFTCGAVEDRVVCRPVAEDSGGCRIAQGGPAPWGIWLCLAGVCLSRRRTRKVT